MPKSLILEVAVDSLDDAARAEECGADRLELCGDLASHGLTPGAELVREVKARVGIPVLAMVRARPGPFVLDERNREVERDHAAAMLDAGADGIVFGGLTPGGRVDLDAAERLATLASGRQTVFHRAIDLATDREDALRHLAARGITRVLTAAEAPARAAASLGLAPAAAPPDGELEDRWARFGSMSTLAGGRLELIAGGGVRAGNAAGWIRRAGAVQLHSSGRTRGGASLDVAELLKLREAINAAQDAGC